MTDDASELLTAIYGSFASGDATVWIAAMDDETLCIGTDEAEWWPGIGTAGPIIEAQLAEMSGAGITVTGGEPVHGEHGDVVWAADRPTLHLADGSSQAMRATVVAVRGDAGLVIRQMHLSVAAANEEVVQQTLTL